MMLNVIDSGIIVVYLLLMVVIGIACRGRQDSTADYFTARGKLGGFIGTAIVGLSIAATFFSGISFLAYPSLVFRSGLLILMGLPTFAVVWIVLRYFFLPRYVAGHWREPYEVLERGYGRSVRELAAVFFILMRIGWMAALIYAPTLALMAATGLDARWFWPLILIVGMSSTLYTVLGGIRGVIITDAIQMLIILVGIAVALLYIVLHLPIPLGEAMSHLHAQGRLKTFEPSLSFTTPLTFWGVTIGLTFSSLGAYIGDQMSLQRYLSLPNIKDNARSFLINVVGVVIVVVLLAGIGVLLAAWYETQAASELPKSADEIFPAFIGAHLPTGLRGLILAALLAATMSSITSGINALAASITLDFKQVQRALRTDDPQRQLRVARLVSLAIGIISTLLAGAVAYLGQLFDIAQKVIGVFTGPLAILLLLAVFKVRTSPRMMIVAALVGSAVGWVIALGPAVFGPSFPAIDSVWVAPATSIVTLCLAALGTKRRNEAEVEETSAELASASPND
jgi:SSS family transporter